MTSNAMNDKVMNGADNVEPNCFAIASMAVASANKTFLENIPDMGKLQSHENNN